MNAIRKYDILELDNEYQVSESASKDEEIKNNPFGLDIDVKGLTCMSHEKNLSNYAEQLVAHYGKYSHEEYELTLEMLPEDEQNELARLYIESIDREIEWACYGDDESINSEFLCAMLAMLKNDNVMTRQRFAKITRKNILTYYKKQLNEVLEQACDACLCTMMTEAGYSTHTDRDHGDTTWR